MIHTSANNFFNGGIYSQDINQIEFPFVIKYHNERGVSGESGTGQEGVLIGSTLSEVQPLLHLPSPCSQANPFSKLKIHKTMFSMPRN
jgi:hypothetical protein